MQRTNQSPSSRRHPVRHAALPALLSCAVALGACSSSTDTETTATPTTAESANTESTNTTPTTGAPTTLPATERATTPDEVLAELGEQGFIGTVMVRHGGEEWSASFGEADRAGGVANELDTVFDIGSLSKQFTAAAIIRLEMDGLLSVDDPVGRYVDGLSAEQSEITLHQLLTHTSGLPHGLGPDDETIDLPAYLDRVATAPFDAEPGEQWGYSNVGYSLLGAVIESVSGTSYEDYLQTALFEPAGMIDTGYLMPDWSDQAVAIGYTGDDSFGRPNEQPWLADGPGWNLRANGGLLSTVPDLMRWEAALLDGSVLDAEAAEKLFTPHVPIDGGEYFSGYGWLIVPVADDQTLITHNGGNGIFYADFLHLVEEDLTVVLATNVAASVDDAGWTVIEGVLDADDSGTDDSGDEELCELTTTLAGVADDTETIDELPETLEGDAMSVWIDTLLSLDGPGNEAELAEFIEEAVGSEYLEVLGPDAVNEMITALQSDLDGFEVESIHQENASTFHVVVAPTAGATEALISARIDADGRVECTGFD